MATTFLSPPTAAPPAATAKALRAYARLHELMRRYQVKDLVHLDGEALKAAIAAYAARDNEPGQHPNEVRFHWGHRHDFGEFSVPGRMGNHHVAVIATLVEVLEALPMDLAGARVLDIGCWTGGTSLLLAAMGARVFAVEEIPMYADCARFLARAFGVETMEVRATSLYGCTGPELQDAFDFVLFAGVLHHLSDPKLALRIAFNCLRDGGKCLIETLSVDHDRKIVARREREQLDPDADEPWGWNWLLFTPPTLHATLRQVGFVIDRPCTVVDGRTFVVGRRDRHVDLRRTGFSVRDIR